MPAPNNEVIAPEHVIDEFLESLQGTIDHAKRVQRLGFNTTYNGALTTFLNYANLLELAFKGRPATVDEMLYFGRRGGRIGVPIKLTTFVPEDEGEDDGE